VFEEFIPSVGSFERSEAQHRLSLVRGPAHAAGLETILDQMSAGPFDHAGCDQQPGGKVFVVFHWVSVSREVAAGGCHYSTFLFRNLLECRHAA